MIEKITCADVKPIREAMGLNKPEFANEIHATRSAVAAWELEAEGSTRRIHPIFASQLRKLKKKYIS